MTLLANAERDDLKLEKHPDKTFIGRIGKCFDFLGYHISPDGLSVAQPTLDRFVEKATRPSQQAVGKPEGSPLPGLYVSRWLKWTTAGFPVGRVAQAVPVSPGPLIKATTM